MMRKAKVFNHDELAGYLTENDDGTYYFDYLETYQDAEISLTMPTSQKHYTFTSFPPFFDGLLPEGLNLEGLLRKAKLDRNDCFSQLIIVGSNCVGSVTVEPDQ
jgi:serine/threonine-protein kinase HipA